MTGQAQNKIISLHPGQETSETRAWDRMPGEKALWYQRFLLYCRLGRGRSVQAALEIEQAGTQAQLGTKKSIYDDDRRFSDFNELRSDTRVTVPGAWKRACVTFAWVQRAEAWDIDQRRLWEQRLDQDIRLDAAYTSAQYRIWVLNSFAVFMQKMVTETKMDDVSFKERIDAVRLSQALLKDIRMEMEALEKQRP